MGMLPELAPGVVSVLFAEHGHHCPAVLGSEGREGLSPEPDWEQTQCRKLQSWSTRWSYNSE